MPTPSSPSDCATVFLSIEDELFAHDADACTRIADAFVRDELRAQRGEERAANVRPLKPLLPTMPGTYARFGGETVVVRCNDVALTLAGRLRAAA